MLASQCTANVELYDIHPEAKTNGNPLPLCYQKGCEGKQDYEGWWWLHVTYSLFPPSLTSPKYVIILSNQCTN